MVKASFKKLAGKALAAATAHLNYLQRDGVTREGAAGQMYGRDDTPMTAKDFMAGSAEDRHQFRLIVSPEDGARFEDLKPLIRKLMLEIENDLKTKLDWAAVDHHNTGHPHTHIVIRGIDDQGKDLVIAGEYLSSGIRARMEDIVTRELGPRSELEILAARQTEMGLERLTSIDRHLQHDQDRDGRVTAEHTDPVIQALRAGRLVKLEALGLAENLGEGQWSLSPDMVATLNALGVRGDIIKTLHASLTTRGMRSAITEAVIHEPTLSVEAPAKPITGRILERGLADEMADRHYLTLEAVDGRVHYIDLGVAEKIEPLPIGGIVQVIPNRPGLKAADHTIMAVAAENEGAYSVDAHLLFDPNARQPFAETHARRLEAIRRAGFGVERDPDGQFRIGDGYAERALAYERRQVSLAPAEVTILSRHSLQDQTHRYGMTWLDQELVAQAQEGFAYSGFGGEARQAMLMRQQWLIKEGLATDIHGEFVPAPKLLQTLQEREISVALNDLSRRIGLEYSPAIAGERVEGQLRQSIALSTVKFAVIERARDFTVVPWRPVLEPHVGKTISGVVRDSGINWTIGRGKDIGIE